METKAHEIRIEKTENPFRNDYGRIVNFKVFFGKTIWSYEETIEDAEEAKKYLECYINDIPYTKNKFIIDCSTKNENGCTEGSVKVKIAKVRKSYPNYNLEPIRFLSGRYNILATLK